MLSLPFYVLGTGTTFKFLPIHSANVCEKVSQTHYRVVQNPNGDVPTGMQPIMQDDILVFPVEFKREQGTS